MNFEVKKAENCFSNAENYEYQLEQSGKAMAEALQPQARQLKINDKLRRPTFTALLDNGTQIKGLLGKTVIKVGYVPGQAAAQKSNFEKWLRGL